MKYSRDLLPYLHFQFWSCHLLNQPDFSPEPLCFDPDPNPDVCTHDTDLFTCQWDCGTTFAAGSGGIVRYV